MLDKAFAIGQSETDLSTRRLKQSNWESEAVDPGYWFFKLFNSIKEEHEVDFAELELCSLLGPVERIRNFADVLHSTPLKHFTSDHVRIQDFLTYEPCYGQFQGFMATLNTVPNIAKLVRRLAYTREIIGVVKTIPKRFLNAHLPKAKSRAAGVSYNANGFTLLRFVTNQFYQEKSAYVSKLSRNEKEIQLNIKTLVEYPFREFYRIPASATMSIGKRLQDYFTIREEGSLYLTHNLHPYKGKFHAKMVRALLNYVMPEDNGRIMDNFAGSGTLLLEASLMGLENIGVDINPLSALMSSVKSESLNLDPGKLKYGISLFLKEVSSRLSQNQKVKSGLTAHIQAKLDSSGELAGLDNLSESVRDIFGSHELIQKFKIAQRSLAKLAIKEAVRSFILLGLSGTISDLARRTSQDFFEVLSARLSWMYRQVFLFSELNSYLNVSPGKSATYIGDARDMRVCSTPYGMKVSLPDNSIDAIVNSPPYSTALDYVRNDLPQLTILGIAQSLDKLERNMIGNPNLRYYSRELSDEIENNGTALSTLPREGIDVVHRLIRQDRKKEALRTYKFLKDIRETLLEMKRVLRPGGRAVIIIGNNHYKLDGQLLEVKNDEIIACMADEVGLVRDDKVPLGRRPLNEQDDLGQIPGGIRRKLEKTMSGMIRYETVLILRKP